MQLDERPFPGSADEDLERRVELGNLRWPSTAGCREHVALIAWHDRERQRLVLTGEVVDEHTEPGVLRYELIVAVDAGPFLAASDLDAAAATVVAWCKHHWGFLG